MRVYITREVPEAAKKILTDASIKVTTYKGDNPIPRDILIKKVKDIDGLISLLSDNIDKEVIDAMPNCKVIANYAVGYNNIDLKYARKKGIIVANTPDVLTNATAEIAMALTLACSRRIREGEEMMRAGQFKGWSPKLLLGPELTGKMFGIIGAGRIGTATAIRAKGFGTKILYFSRRKNQELEKKTGAVRVSLDTLLSLSDFISIHVPLTDRTYHLLNKENLELLKNSAILINTARGEIVDEKELIRILKKKKIFAAGFDVYENEPNVNPDLLKLDNVVLLPHVGSGTIEARDRMASLAAFNVLNVLKGSKALSPVI